MVSQILISARRDGRRWLHGKPAGGGRSLLWRALLLSILLTAMLKPAAAYASESQVPTTPATVETPSAIQPAERPARQAALPARFPKPRRPDLGNLEQRLAVRGLAKGNPVFIRIFKAESVLELWMRAGDRYQRLANYPICKWDGEIGPKLLEGDRQSPEGFYTVAPAQLRWVGRWHRGFDLNFPNAYDEAQRRTGSYLMVHGGCSSIGCYAMTDAVIEEIFGLMTAALEGSQRRVPVHIFPFRMTDDNLTRRVDSPWSGFWRNLRQGHDAFETSGLPPVVSACDNRYRFRAAKPGEEDLEVVAAACLPSFEAAAGEPFAVVRPYPEIAPRISVARAKLISLASRGQVVIRKGATAAAVEAIPVKCNLSLPSCRRWLDLKKKSLGAKLQKPGKSSKSGKLAKK